LLKVDYCNFPAATAAAAILLPTLTSLLAALPAAYVNRHPGQ
jgi:flagellar transcriptional activator FlhC